MTKGVLYFAKNNEKFDYIRQAVVSAVTVKYFLKVPTAIICDKSEFDPRYRKYFDEVIDLSFSEDNHRRFIDSNDSKSVLSWFNGERHLAYDISPFDETLLVDTDFIFQNDIMNLVWGTRSPMMINSSSRRVDDSPEHYDERFIYDGGPKMFWATVVYFKKSEQARDFFDITKELKTNWSYYARLYQIPRFTFRNDYAFTMAAHIQAGFTEPSIPKLPCKQINSYSPDKILHADIGTMTIKTKNMIAKINGLNVHLMNKFEFANIEEKLLEVYDVA